MNNEPCEFLPVKDWNEKPEPRVRGHFLLGVFVGIVIGAAIVKMLMM
jgi:hypothetical protein